MTSDNGPADGSQSRRGRAAWALFDWASNAFATVILSFVFSAYFTREVAATPEAGTTAWGTAIAISGIAVALVAPVAGAIADQGGRVKPWLAVASALCIAATAGLWFVEPATAFLVTALVLVGIANFGFEMSYVFYNALLPRLEPSRRMGRLSGWGWGLGYAGGLSILCLALFGFIRAEPPPFGLDPSSAEHVRIAGPLAAAWFLIFSLPLFVWTPDWPGARRRPMTMIRQGLGQLVRTVKRVRAHANACRFLLARLVYYDGLNTMFVFGGVYAAGTFDMDVAAVTLFGIALNVCAGVGAALGGWIDDWIGPKRTILGALIGLMACGIVVVVTTRLDLFWVFGVALGLFMGPVQAASRSLMGRIAPTEMATQMYGLYATSGKATAFVGPALVATIAELADSQRIAVASILLFFLGGTLLLLRVKDPEA
jgi:UMF1 family MFS transporter